MFALTDVLVCLADLLERTSTLAAEVFDPRKDSGGVAASRKVVPTAERENAVTPRR